MIDGTPASSSTAVPIGRRSQTGQISVRNRAMPKLTGKAISKAMTEVTRVPVMAISAPYLSLTGSHSMLVMKPGPNSRKAGMAPMISETIMPTSTSSTDAANSIVTLWKMKSWMRCLRIVECIAAWRSAASGAIACRPGPLVGLHSWAASSTCEW